LGESLTVREIYCPSSSSRRPVVSVNDSVVVIRARKMRAVQVLGGPLQKTCGRLHEL